MRLRICYEEPQVLLQALASCWASSARRVAVLECNMSVVVHQTVGVVTTQNAASTVKQPDIRAECHRPPGSTGAVSCRPRRRRRRPQQPGTAACGPSTPSSGSPGCVAQMLRELSVRVNGAAAFRAKRTQPTNQHTISRQAWQSVPRAPCPAHLQYHACLQLVHFRSCTTCRLHPSQQLATRSTTTVPADTPHGIESPQGRCWSIRCVDCRYVICMLAFWTPSYALPGIQRARAASACCSRALTFARDQRGPHAPKVRQLPSPEAQMASTMEAAG